MAEARDIEADLDWLVGRIREGYEPEKIFLFGPLARGDTHEWSDIDLIVVKHTDASYGQRVREPLPVPRDRLVGADIPIYTPEEYERGKRARWGLIRDAERDGRVLYERGRRSHGLAALRRHGCAGCSGPPFGREVGGGGFSRLLSRS